MTDERVVEDIVSKFLLNTCRQRPWLTGSAVQAAGYCASHTIGTFQCFHPAYDAEADRIPLITGSIAEFYIEPMIPHVGDVDVMLHGSNKLAIPQGHRPPTHLSLIHI